MIYKLSNEVSVEETVDPTMIPQPTFTGALSKNFLEVREASGVTWTPSSKNPSLTILAVDSLDVEINLTDKISSDDIISIGLTRRCGYTDYERLRIPVTLTGTVAPKEIQILSSTVTSVENLSATGSQNVVVVSSDLVDCRGNGESNSWCLDACAAPRVIVEHSRGIPKITATEDLTTVTPFKSLPEPSWIPFVTGVPDKLSLNPFPVFTSGGRRIRKTDDGVMSSIYKPTGVLHSLEGTSDIVTKFVRRESISDCVLSGRVPGVRTKALENKQSVDTDSANIKSIAKTYEDEDKEYYSILDRLDAGESLLDILRSQNAV